MLTNKLNLGARVGIALAAAALCAAPALGDHFPKPRPHSNDVRDYARECQEAGHQVEEISQRYFGSEICNTEVRACRFAPSANPSADGKTGGCVFNWDVYDGRGKQLRFGHIYADDSCRLENLMQGEETYWDTCEQTIPKCPQGHVRRIDGVNTNNRFAPCVPEGPDPAVNEQDRAGRTPLHLALMRGNHDEVGPLLARGADLSLADRRGWTALHHAAAAKGNTGALVRMMLEAHPDLDVNVQSRRGETPLHIAVANPDGAGAIQELLQAGADTQLTDRRRRTARDLAEIFGIAENIRLLDEQ